MLEHWKANEVLKGGGHDGSMVSKTLARQTSGVVLVDRDYLVELAKGQEIRVALNGSYKICVVPIMH